jgi:quercetin dioxygenase-like cupin family protein
MKITRSEDAQEAPFDAETFDGPVRRMDYGSIDAPAGTVLHVRFPAGGRTHWHSHPGGQVLYVTEGVGRVGTREGAVETVRAGDVVVAPPGEVHWHGAATDAEVRHLALSFGPTEWYEAVEG